MKAISKSYGNFEVRFSTPSIFNLKRLSTYDSFENSGLVKAEINFKGVWYPVTLEYKMLNKDCRIPVAVLSKKAADAFGVEYDFNREPAIMLDKDYDKDYKSFIAEQVEAARAKANTCDFSQVHIATYCDIVSIYGWDADEDNNLAFFNDQAREILDTFTAAYKVDCHKVSTFFWDKNAYNFDDKYFIVTKHDLATLKEMAAPEFKRQQQAKERRENIANGAIYFHCESQPHDVDLTGMVLTRPCPQSGTFTLTHQIDKADFERIKKYGRYYDAEFLEDCDMFYSAPGWRFGAQAVEELAKHHRVFVDNKEVK